MPEADGVGQEIAIYTALEVHNVRLLATEWDRANEWALLHQVIRAAIPRSVERRG